MRNRRNRFKPNVDNINTLYIIKIALKILIVILLFIFIFSSIKMKTSINQQNILAKNNTSNETNENKQLDINRDTNNKNAKSNTTSEINEITQQKNEPQSTTINMALTGDIMCHNTIYKDAFNSETESYDFSYIFEDIKYNIQTADIAVR